jgi:hypothetical protein
MVKRLVVLSIAILALGALYAAATISARPDGTDEGQIRAALVDAINAMNHGHVTSAMSVVSPDYKDSTGFTRERLWLLANRAAENRKEWTAMVTQIKPRVEGNDASVSITLRVTMASGHETHDYPITLTMRREDSRAWLLVPTRRWHILGSTGLPPELLDLAG